MNKRGYFVHNSDEWYGFAVVATSAKEAKKIVYDSGELPINDWIDIRVRWIRDAKVGDLPIGMVTDNRDALIRGIYGTLAEYPCDECGAERDVTCCNGRVLCSCCIEKEYRRHDMSSNSGSVTLERGG